MHPEDRVLVALMNNERDFDLARDEGWYRIPTKHAPATLALQIRVTTPRTRGGS